MTNVQQQYPSGRHELLWINRWGQLRLWHGRNIEKLLREDMQVNKASIIVQGVASNLENTEHQLLLLEILLILKHPLVTARNNQSVNPTPLHLGLSTKQNLPQTIILVNSGTLKTSSNEECSTFSFFNASKRMISASEVLSEMIAPLPPLLY